MTADTLAQALSLVRRLREAASNGQPVVFKPTYEQCLNCERKLEEALQKITVTLTP